MNILPIAAPHMEKFIPEAAKKHLFWIREYLILQNFTKRLIMTASNIIMFASE